jgi:hypothetical protein
VGYPICTVSFCPFTLDTIGDFWLLKTKIFDTDVVFFTLDPIGQDLNPDPEAEITPKKGKKQQ